MQPKRFSEKMQGSRMCIRFEGLQGRKLPYAIALEKMQGNTFYYTIVLGTIADQSKNNG
jgi:hypothetical protein